MARMKMIHLMLKREGVGKVASRYSIEREGRGIEGKNNNKVMMKNKLEIEWH